IAVPAALMCALATWLQRSAT
ncbi:DUF3649 domain-containing protein, partial [Xanthomonas oryzae pv. oryzae]